MDSGFITALSREPRPVASEAAPRTDGACTAPLPEREPPGRPLPVAASYLHAGNHFRKLGSTVKIDAAQDVWFRTGGRCDKPARDRKDPRRIERRVAAPARAGRQAAQRRGDRPGRCRIRTDRVLRSVHRYPAHRRTGRRRHSLFPIPYHVAVLADARGAADRAQPPQQRHGLHPGAGAGLPRLPRRHTGGERDALGDSAQQGLQHLRSREMAPHPGLRADVRRPLRSLAAGARIRALLRVPDGDDGPLAPGRAGAGQSIRRLCRAATAIT